jgi:SAM-dependent methyltransferase
MESPSSCPLCGGPLRATGVRSIDRLVTDDGPFAISECPSCRYGVTLPQMSDEELERYYGSGYYACYYGHGGEGPHGLLEHARELFRRRAGARRANRPPFAADARPAGRVLDVGCGSGELLSHYREHGWETFGIDPSEQAAALARERGASVHRGTLADQPWPVESFDLIVFSHSLEHIPQPVQALRLARGLLADGGRLAIAVPNWRCWQRHVFGGRWAHLDLPRHLQHFSPRSLTVIAGVLDLEVVELGTSSTVIAVAYSLHYVIAGRWTPGWKLWLAYALGAAVFPAVAVVNRLLGADCAYAVLRRPEI